MDSSSAPYMQIKNRLKSIYKHEISDEQVEQFVRLTENNKQDVKAPTSKWDEKDTILITYGDSVKHDNEYPLQVLKRFLNNHLKPAISCVHILPFFPYSSDDGFSVMDYTKVNPALGTWKDVEDIHQEFDVMMDLVINHVSQKHQWFQNYLEDKEPGKGYFIDVDPDTDLSQVVRPRSSPLLTAFSTKTGTRHVWTTFSSDQVDLNFSNPDLLYEIIEVLFHYIHHGAKIIRLDAIAFIWKKTGTTCLHLPEVHEIVKLFRDIVEYAAPQVILLTETNVPNKENLSYFGDGDEANMVYQFSLPPLLLHGLHTGNSEYLKQWAKEIPDPGPGSTYFNFTASHDGIGVRPLEGLLPEDEKNTLITNMQKFGGQVSTKTNPDGTDSPYELNITYYDALKGTVNGEDNLQKERFICSQTIMMAMKGIPAFYIHSLTATPNHYDGVNETGIKRAINRKKWDEQTINELLEHDKTHSYVFNELKRLIVIRKNEVCFHPDAGQSIIECDDRFFIISRSDEGRFLLSVSNLTSKYAYLSLKSIQIEENIKDLISGKTYSGFDEIHFAPYQTMWLVNE